MSQLPFAKYDAEFRKDHPETIGETDQTFDLANYCEWLEKRVADRDRLAAELARVRSALEGVEPYLEEDPDDDGDYNQRVREVRAALAQPQDGTT